VSVRRASLVVLALVAARCTFPDVSMVASSGPSADVVPADGGGEATRDSSAEGGAGESDGQTVQGSADANGASTPNLDATDVTDAADASTASVEAGVVPGDGESPVDAGGPRFDAGGPGVDASKPPQDAGGVQDAGRDAGHKKQYPANVDCTSVDLADCNSTTGFADDPDCGDTGTLVQCGTTTSKGNSGDNGNGNGNDEASRDRESCVILLQVTAVQTCL
jgi:hypothetical protein